MYEKFKELNGAHPWRDVSPDGYVDYQARYRSQGRVLYFNFPLAKELGLIPEEHPPTIDKELEQVILETFSLRIINEYDVAHGKKYPPESVRQASTWLRAICKLSIATTRQDFRRRRSIWEWLFEN